jgi:hypothetical protein
MRHVCALHYYEYRGGAGFLMADLGLCIVVNMDIVLLSCALMSCRHGHKGHRCIYTYLVEFLWYIVVLPT